MDLSMKWLADYVDCDMPIKDFVSGITLSGSKVECYNEEGDYLENVVVNDRDYEVVFKAGVAVSIPAK